MLANRIADLRKHAGLSQAQLAKALGISTSAEGMYEQGRRFPSIDTLIAMAKVFDVSLDYLITGAEYHSPVPQNATKPPPVNCPCSTCYWKSINDR